MSKSKGLWNVGFSGVWQRNSLLSQMLHLCESPRLLVTMFDDPALGTLTDHSSRGHDGTIVNMITADRAYKGLGCTYDLTDGDNIISFGDHDDFSFGNGTTDSPFTLGALIEVVPHTANQVVMSKWDGTLTKEWTFQVGSGEQLGLYLRDDSAGVHAYAFTHVLTAGYYWVVATYDGGGGSTAANGINLYVNGGVDNDTVGNNAAYVAMENIATELLLGVRPNAAAYQYPFQRTIGLSLIDGSAWSQGRVTESYRLIKQAYGL